jgi:hypothetical protein
MGWCWECRDLPGFLLEEVHVVGKSLHDTTEA